MKHNEPLTRSRILEILDCKDNYDLQLKIRAAKYDKRIVADDVIHSIMFLWEDAGYIITKPEKTEEGKV